MANNKKDDNKLELKKLNNLTEKNLFEEEMKQT